jgi:hypothetical protein
MVEKSNVSAVLNSEPGLPGVVWRVAALLGRGILAEKTAASIDTAAIQH